MQRAAVFAGFDFQVGLPRLLQGQVLGEGDDAVQAGVVLLQAGQEKGGKLLGSNLPGAEQLAQLPHGVEGQVVAVGGQLYFGGFGQLAGVAVGGSQLRLSHPQRARVEHYGRGHAVGQRDFAQRFVAVAVAVQVAARRIKLGIVEIQPENLLRGPQNGHRNFIGRGGAGHKGTGYKAGTTQQQRGKKFFHAKKGANRTRLQTVSAALVLRAAS